MIYIFHGEDTGKSRQKANAFLDSQNTKNTLRLDHKSSSIDKINLFLNSASFFNEPKLLCIDNFFSIHKATQEKITPILNSSAETILIWQDKPIPATSLKTIAKPIIDESKAASPIWNTIFSVKPGNHKSFSKSYAEMLKTEPYDLFLYILKNSLRKQLETNTKFDIERLKKAYLQLILLDYQNKSGQLAIPKELALQRVILFLLG